MTNPNTFTVSRIELRRILAAHGMNDKRIDEIFASMEREHRHINVVQLVNLLEKEGMSREKVTNVFRRLNMNDITISEVLDLSDESKISAEIGRLYNATIEFG